MRAYKEIVSVIANGIEYSRWEAVKIKKRIGIDWSFEFRAAEKNINFTKDALDEWAFPPCTPIAIYATGQPIFERGRVYEYAPRGDATMHEVIVSGRADAIEFALATPKHDTGTFEDQTVKEIIEELAKGMGLDVKQEGQEGQPIKVFQIRQGSTAFAEAMRILPSRALYIKTADGGDLVISDGKKKQHHIGALVQGHNIESMSGSFSLYNAYSEIEAAGQNVRDDEGFSPVGKAYDNTLCFNRYKLIIEPAESNSKMLQKRACWEMLRAKGLSATAEITVNTWRDDAGQFWRPDCLIFVEAKWLKLAQDMLIVEVTFRQDDKHGTQADLVLMDPRSYGGTEPQGWSPGGIWDFPVGGCD